MSELLNSTGSSGYYAPWHENILSWTKNQFYGFADSFQSRADIIDWCDAGECGVDRG